MTEEKVPSLAVRLQRLGIHKSRAYMIVWGKRPVSLPLALRIHRELGEKLGPLAPLTDEQVAILAETQREDAA